jgi:hypothetical protein
MRSAQHVFPAVDRYHVFATIFLSAAVLPASAVEVYHNDFDTGDIGAEWSTFDPDLTLTADVSPSGERFLGQFDVYATVLSLSDLPAHSMIRADFDLYLIGSWDGKADLPDGNDIFTLDNILDFDNGGDFCIWFFTTFSNTDSNQDYPGGFGSGDNVARTGAFAVNTLDYAESNGGDTIYRLSVTFPHTISSLELSFFGDVEPDPGHLLTDESWGIDNVTITAISEPASSCLLFFALPFLLRRRLLPISMR